MSRPIISIIGGGPSALSAAYFLSNNFEITIYEKEKNIGNKFLVAGKGGFNITNSLTRKTLAAQYIPKDFLTHAILNFDSGKVREWFDYLSINTFIGTSGRVYVDKKLKPAEVLAKLKYELIKKGVNILTGYSLNGFDENSVPIIIHRKKRIKCDSDFYIFGLGGASWRKTGSDGKWLSYFDSIGIITKIFEPSNCGVNVVWPAEFSNNHSGKPLKNIAVKYENKIYRGEATITGYGLEGNAIYSVVPNLREALKKGIVTIKVDLKPNNSLTELNAKVKKQNVNSKQYRQLLNINNVEMALLKSHTTKEEFTNPIKFLKKLKGLDVRVNSLRPINEAISTVGGIPIEELNRDFSLKKYPDIYTIGEMVDWDAPTGGFLLQGCFSMGYQSAMSINTRQKVSKK